MFNIFIQLYGLPLFLLVTVYIGVTVILNRMYTVDMNIISKRKIKRRAKNIGTAMFIIGTITLISAYLLGYLIGINKVNLILVTLMYLITILILSLNIRKYDNYVNENEKCRKKKMKYYNKTDKNVYIKKEKKSILMLVVNVIVFYGTFVLYILEAMGIINLQKIFIGAIAPMYILLVFELIKYLIWYMNIYMIRFSFENISNNFQQNNKDKGADK